MMEKIQRKFALSPQGAKDLIKSIICCTLQNIVLMFPVCLLYLLVQDLMNGGVSGTRTGFYIAGIVVCLALICAVTYFQYNAAFLATYVESGVRRIHLSEKLRENSAFLFRGKRPFRFDQHHDGRLCNAGNGIFSLHSGIGRLDDFYCLDCIEPALL